MMVGPVEETCMQSHKDEVQLARERGVCSGIVEMSWRLPEWRPPWLAYTRTWDLRVTHTGGEGGTPLQAHQISNNNVCY